MAKENAKCMFLISTLVDDTQMQSLLVCETAHKMWNKLRSIHEQWSETSRLTITQCFHEYWMNAYDSVVAHVAKVENLGLQLRNVGEKISDVAVMAKVIEVLPSKYKSLKTAWDSVPASQQNMETLTERLIKEECQMNMSDEETGAFAVMSINRQKGNARYPYKTKSSQEQETRSDIECFYC
ncbi:uncharacterized protein LOC126447546 [Schistocerca serialis cubense]|uniref:uncharacterized protein LOC126447546 n=1 Tax=Schistocerca serialis cubense TaxID=2023355 RepID=UPI00214EC569|nr:uncharacterized protein LOC126447546 [Schistocerca serialis cubense]